MDDLQRIANSDNLIAAFKEAKKNCIWKASVQEYEMNLLRNTYHLHQELINRTYKQGGLLRFNLTERGKTRQILAAHVRDRVVQRSLCDNLLTPTLLKKCIYDNSASVKNKGVLFARNRIKCHLEKYWRKCGEKGYILLIDFHNFFGSIPQDLVLRRVYSLIEDKTTEWLTALIVKSYGNKGIGIGIGSHVSQILGVYYLTDVDNLCKITYSCKYYGRYMDDIYIICRNKIILEQMLSSIIQTIQKLGLSINYKKTKISKLSDGFIFLKHKYHYTPTGKVVGRLSRDTITRERQKLVSYSRLVNKKVLTFIDIMNFYKSWRNNNLDLNSHKTIQSMDKKFYHLFKR